MLSEEFCKAAYDYSFLINRGYSGFSAKKFVGDHYALSGVERSMLFRGIFTSEESAERKSRMLKPEAIADSTLHIDALNVVYSVSAYLEGKQLFIATDGLLRDAAEYHGKRIKKERIQKCMLLLFEYLDALQLERADFFVDKPLYNSRIIWNDIRLRLSAGKLDGEVELFAKPDEILVKMKQGVLCSSDSEVIGKSDLPVFDLPRNLLHFHFKPDFCQLKKFCNFAST